MNVIGYDIVPSTPVPNLSMVPLDELLAKSDYISLHLPLTEGTRHLIGADAIAKMKTGVKIINCARGGVLDEAALYDALVAGKVAGAALDVFEVEPPTDARLLALEQVIGSPHVGANTKEATSRIGGEVAELLINFGR
jgi:D-3-phosphoglycerate dehydrogenase